MAAWDWLFGRNQPPATPIGGSGVAAGDAAVVEAEATTQAVTNLDRVATDMLKEFVRSIYLWRCVDMIAQMASSVPLSVEPEDDRDLTPDEVAIEELIEQPNPQWTGAALQYYVAACLAVANKVFLLRVRGVGGVTLELWPI